MTEITKLRKGGHGLAGTYANIAHHAKGVKPLVDALVPYCDKMGFKEWKQGHNIHLLITKDGRKYDIVPTTTDGSYTGLRIRIRLSRSKNIPLLDFFDVNQLWDVVNFLRTLANPLRECNIGGGIKK